MASKTGNLRALKTDDEDKIIEAVVKIYKREVREIYGVKNKPLKEKKIAMYLLKRFTVMTNIQIGKKFGITFSGVSKAAKDIEKLTSFKG